MKRYSEKTNDWAKNKALSFWVNFINNHKGYDSDNDPHSGNFDSGN